MSSTHCFAFNSSRFRPCWHEPRVLGESFKDLNESYILVGSEVVLLAGLQTTPLCDGYP